MSYDASDGTELFNYDEMWELLKLADIDVPALIDLAFGGSPDDRELLKDLNALRNHVHSTHELIPAVDRAIGALHQLLQG